MCVPAGLRFFFFLTGMHPTLVSLLKITDSLHRCDFFICLPDIYYCAVLNIDSDMYSARMVDCGCNGKFTICFMDKWFKFERTSILSTFILVLK